MHNSDVISFTTTISSNGKLQAPNLSQGSSVSSHWYKENIQKGPWGVPVGRSLNHLVKGPTPNLYVPSVGFLLTD